MKHNKYTFNLFYLIFMSIISLVLTIINIASNNTLSAILWLITSVIWGITLGMEIGDILDERNKRD